jgi:hypothetical protein
MKLLRTLASLVLLVLAGCAQIGTRNAPELITEDFLIPAA